jgi:hypothetical protein
MLFDNEVLSNFVPLMFPKLPKLCNYMTNGNKKKAKEKDDPPPPLNFDLDH